MQTLSYNAIVQRSKKHIFGDMVGGNASRKEGDGYDFSQIRPYMYGENIKRIDWKQSAKTGEIQVRSFFEEKEIHIHVLALMSGSMHFGIDRMKQEVMSEIIALLGFSGIKNGDFFALSLLASNLLGTSPSSKKEALVRASISMSLQAKLIGNTIDWDFVTQYALYHIKKPSLLFLIGDFFTMPKLEAISKKHEVIVVKVRDHFEEKPPIVGTLFVKDPQSLKEEKVVLDANFVKSYTQQQKQFDLKLEGYFKKQGVKNFTIYTNEDPYIKLSSLLRSL